MKKINDVRHDIIVQPPRGKATQCPKYRVVSTKSVGILGRAGDVG